FPAAEGSDEAGRAPGRRSGCGAGAEASGFAARRLTASARYYDSSMRRSKLRRRESGSKLPHSQSGLRPRSESVLLEALAAPEASERSPLPLRGVRVGLVVLAQQIFAVVVAVGCADDAVDVLLRGLVRIGGEPREVCWQL